jgi:uncharacterized protein
VSNHVIQIEIAHFDQLLQLCVAKATTVADAIAQSGLTNLPPLQGNVGIFARACALDTVLNDGDRIEIYRPLKVDPKVQRRERAGTQNFSKKTNDALQRKEHDA